MSLKQLFADGVVRAALSFGSGGDNSAKGGGGHKDGGALLSPRSYVLCGERTVCNVVLTFQDGGVCEALAQRISARLEGFSVETGAEPPAAEQTAARLQKMRSVESLASLSSEALADLSAATAAAPCKHAVGRMIDAHTVVVSVVLVADSDAPFSKATGCVKISLHEEREHDVLGGLLGEPRMGARLLNGLLVDGDAEWRTASILEQAACIEQRVDIVRPLEAATECFRKSDDATLVSVQLSCREGVAERFTVHELSVAVGEPGSHARGCRAAVAPTFDRRLFHVHPLAVPVPATIRASEVFCCVFEVTALERVVPRGLRLCLDALVSWEDEERLSLSFDCDYDLSGGVLRGPASGLLFTVLLPPSPVHLNEPFALRLALRNETTTARDLVIRKSFGGLDAPFLLPPVASDGRFVPPEKIVDQYYSQYQRLCPSFIPLESETIIGNVAPGQSATAHLRLLPIREGLHWIRDLIVLDRIGGDEFRTNRLLEIRVNSPRET